MYRKSAVALIIAALSVTGSVSAYENHSLMQENPSTSEVFDIQSDATVRVEDISSPSILPRVAWIDNEKYIGKSYKKQFTCYEDEGNKLYIWVRNNGSHDVFVEITHLDDRTWGPYTIKPGEFFHEGYMMLSHLGMRGQWEVYVYPDMNYTMDLEVAANQR